MPKKKKSNLGRKTRNAARLQKSQEQEDEAQSQKRKTRNRESKAISRDLETQEETEERNALKRIREKQKLASMKKDDTKIQKVSSFFLFLCLNLCT